VSTLTIEEAAALVGVSPHAIRRWVACGYLKPVRPGARPLMFDEWDVTECKHDRMPQTVHDTLDAIWADIVAHGE
jgi:excisionase family DNA binding protein